MTKLLDFFEDQKIDKIDSISCHDSQVVKCRKLIPSYTWIDFNKSELLHGILKNENECNI